MELHVYAMSEAVPQDPTLLHTAEGQELGNAQKSWFI
jgi:hypothetical protein